MCWNEWKIIFPIFPIFSFWVIGAKEVTRDAQKKIFKSGQIYKNDRDWSDNDFFFISIVFFCATLSFWDIVNFSNDCVNIFQVFLPTKKGQK